MAGIHGYGIGLRMCVKRENLSVRGVRNLKYRGIAIVLFVKKLLCMVQQERKLSNFMLSSQILFQLQRLSELSLVQNQTQVQILTLRHISHSEIHQVKLKH